MRTNSQLDLEKLKLRADERARVKRLWTRFQPYADPNFARELTIHFHERYWEMCLAYVFLRKRKSMRLQKRSTVGGPDLVVGSDIGTIWIEATAPKCGEETDAVPQPELVDPDQLCDSENPLELLQDTEDYEQVALVPSDEIILRYRTALEEKLRKYVEYIQKGIVPSTAPYVIAINGAAVHPIFGEGAAIPTIAKAVLGLGELQLVYPQDRDGEPVQRILRRDEIQKKSGGKVRTDIFLNEDYSGISGVLFSRCDIMTSLRSLGRDFVFVHNHHSTNRLPHGWLRLGCECWMTENKLQGKVWSSL